MLSFPLLAVAMQPVVGRGLPAYAAPDEGSAALLFRGGELLNHDTRRGVARRLLRKPSAARPEAHALPTVE